MIERLDVAVASLNFKNKFSFQRDCNIYFTVDILVESTFNAALKLE